MPILQVDKQPSVQGIGAGQTATLNMITGPSYHTLYIYGEDGGVPIPAADWEVMLGDIRLIVNGTTIIEASAKYLVARAQMLGYTLTAGVLPIFLTMRQARTANGEDWTVLGTRGVASLTLEMDVLEGTVDKLEVTTEMSGPRDFGKHLEIRRYAKSSSVDGIDEISDFVTGRHVLCGFDIEKSTIGNVEVVADNRKIMDVDAAIRAQRLLDSGRVQQAGYTHLDFMPQNRVIEPAQAANGQVVLSGEPLPMMLQDFRLKLDHTAIPNSYLIYEITIKG